MEAICRLPLHREGVMTRTAGEFHRNVTGMAGEPLGVGAAPYDCFVVSLEIVVGI